MAGTSAGAKQAELASHMKNWADVQMHVFEGVGKMIACSDIGRLYLLACPDDVKLIMDILLLASMVSWVAGFTHGMAITPASERREGE